MGNLCTDLGEFFGVTQEIHHFTQLLLFLVHACHILEGNRLAMSALHNSSLAEV